MKRIQIIAAKPKIGNWVVRSISPARSAPAANQANISPTCWINAKTRQQQTMARLLLRTS